MRTIKFAGCGGKRSRTRPTTYHNRRVQSTSSPPAHLPLLYGKSEGLMVILQEQGLWQPGLRVECKDLKNNQCREGKPCFARKFMVSKPDFKAQHCLRSFLPIETLEICNPSFSANSITMKNSGWQLNGGYGTAATTNF